MKVDNGSLDKLKSDEKKNQVQDLRGLVTQQLLEGTCLQRILFKDIEPVRTIYTNKKFFE